MDRLVASLARLVVKSSRYRRFDVWQPGRPLKILLIGYNGKRNTGADVRVVAMVEQFHHLLGRENVEIGVLTLDRHSLEGYFAPDVRLETFDLGFFWSVLEVCSAYHMGVLAEGSCLMSNFSNLLTLLFVGSAGIMKEQGKPCLAYGVEAGEMDVFMYQAAQRLCAEIYFIARSQASLARIRSMGLKGELGTDTAWIAPAAGRDWARNELKTRAGWDGTRPLLGVAVINPFCWPVKADLGRYLLRGWRGKPAAHYTSWFFFSDSAARQALYYRYLAAIARAVDDFAAARGLQVVILGMEALDADACARLQKMLKAPAAIFGATEYGGEQLTALLRSLSLLVTSRYHARVLSMPAGIPSIAVSMDERLHNLLGESGHLADYCLATDDPHLATRLHAALEQLWREREQVRGHIVTTLPGYLRAMAGMGRTLRRFVRESFPPFPLPPEPADWLACLPPLPSELDEFVQAGPPPGSPSTRSLV